jgi:hypothetical protein
MTLASRKHQNSKLIGVVGNLRRGHIRSLVVRGAAQAEVDDGKNADHSPEKSSRVESSRVYYRRVGLGIKEETTDTL